MSQLVEVFTATNLSHAWGALFLRLYEHRGDLRGPAIVTVAGIERGVAKEDNQIRAALDAELRERRLPACGDSASTIFPYHWWTWHRHPSCEALSKYYLEQLLPRIKGRSHLNRMGTYFERMVSFTGLGRKNGRLKEREVNQLAEVIRVWRQAKSKGRSPRRSALQVSCFDPAKDHTGQVLRGFPCLQQVSFSYDTQGGLSVNAYYPTQYIFGRAYGNYLGLCHLGHFMSHEMHLQLTTINCFIGHPVLDVPKQKLASLVRVVRASIKTSVGGNLSRAQGSTD